MRTAYGERLGLNVHVFFYNVLLFFRKKYAKFNFCIDTNSHALPAAYNLAWAEDSGDSRPYFMCYYMHQNPSKGPVCREFQKKL